MKFAYPIVLKRDGKFFFTSVPDCEISTQGDDVVHAIEMARDAIALWCLDRLEDELELPVPSELASIATEDGDILTLVDIDIEAYKRRYETRTIRRNITLPNWLNEEVNKSGINVSAFIQNALKEELNKAGP